VAKEIPLGELSLLKKAMAMTTADNDNEALAALRKANAILKKYELSWVDVLTRAVNTGGSTYGRSFADPATAGDIEEDDVQLPIDQQIVRAFNELRGKPLGNRQFIDSLEDQFAKRKWLTEAQRIPLFKTVLRLREAGR
jgi:hypothetical protein